VTKKATRFDEKQKSCLLKSPEVVTVEQKMKHAKDEDKIRRITFDYFLTSRHVQSFSRMTAKLRNRQEEVLEKDTTAR